MGLRQETVEKEQVLEKTLRVESRYVKPEMLVRHPSDVKWAFG